MPLLSILLWLCWLIRAIKPPTFVATNVATNVGATLVTATNVARKFGGFVGGYVDGYASRSLAYEHYSAAK